MSRAIDVALISVFALLVVAKLLSLPPEIGIPAAFAGGIANGWRLLSQDRGARHPDPDRDRHPESH